MISFKVNEKAQKSLGKNLFAGQELKKLFENATKLEIEACGSSHNKAKFSSNHPFIEAADLAFSGHYPLTISPDSVWFCIAQGFANHVNVNAEALRKKFVSHEGKEAIILLRNNFIKGSPDNDWRGCFSEFSDKLAKRIGKKRDLVVGNFSTTSDIEKAVSEIVLMDSMKSYFKFGVMTLCGIPQINLTGTVEDWKNILTRVQNLSEFSLSWWTDSLSPIIEKIIDTANSKIDVKFWDSMYKHVGGSGGDKVSGWINTLFPYLEEHNGNKYQNSFVTKWEKSHYGPTTDKFSSGLSKVPFKWQYYDATYDMEFIGGMIGIHQDPQTLSLEPEFAWAIAYKQFVKEGPIDPNEDW